MTTVALVQCFTGGGTKLTDAPGMPGLTMGALHRFFRKKHRVANLLCVMWGSDAISLQFLFACFRHPVCCPGR